MLPLAVSLAVSAARLFPSSVPRPVCLCAPSLPVCASSLCSAPIPFPAAFVPATDEGTDVVWREAAMRSRRARETERRWFARSHACFWPPIDMGRCRLHVTPTWLAALPHWSQLLRPWLRAQR